MARGPIWTAREDRIIAAAAGAGKTAEDAARKMKGRTTAAVATRASRLGILFGPRPPKPLPPIATPAPRGGSPTPGPPPEDTTCMDAEDAQRHLSHMARHAEDPRIRIHALSALLAWKERQPAQEADPDRIPEDLREAWEDPVFGPFLRRLVAKARTGGAPPEIHAR